MWPRTPGDQYESTEYLGLLREHRKDFTLFSGLSHQNQTGRQPHDSQLSWLTAAQNPGTAGFRNTISIDQVAANKHGYITWFPSIALGSDSTLSQSYTSNGVMIPSETSPANLFAKLFLQGKSNEIERQKRQLNEGRSILDQLGSEADKIRRRASTVDNNLLKDYFDFVRQAEKEISAVQDWMEKPKPSVSAQPLADVQDRADIVGRMQLLMEFL